MEHHDKILIGGILLLAGFLTYTTSNIFYLIENSPYVPINDMYTGLAGASLMPIMPLCSIVMILIGLYLLLTAVINNRNKNTE